MKILNRYVLREHLGPFLFAVIALTSLMLLQYIARQFGNLVGKGIGWGVILEFFLLSIPFVVAMTLPMAVLVSVLYAFSRLGSENEITALRAGGISTRSLVNTVLIAASFLAMGMVAFNDQVMPRTNHRLATLQTNIAVTKPTFALREQVINEIQPERLALSAAKIDEATSKLFDVTIHDLSDPSRRRTIIADSGRIALAPNRRDIILTLYDGYMMSMPTQKKGELDRLYFDVDLIRVRDVANVFEQTSADSSMKGDREMTVCEMQGAYERRAAEYQRAKGYLDEAEWRAAGANGEAPKPTRYQKQGGLGAVYCQLVKWIETKVKGAGPKVAHAAIVTKSGSSANPGYSANSGGTLRSGSAAQLLAGQSADVAIQQAELAAARRARDRYGVEIQKKFSLAVACVVLALVGAPIALRFPRGGVGLVIGVSFTIFALYYIGLIGGEGLANKGYLSPFWAMWAANIIFLVIGLILYSRMGHEASTSRGGDFREMLYILRQRINGRSALDAPVSGS